MLRKLAEALDNRHERKSLDRLASWFNHQIQTYANADFATRVVMEASCRDTYHAFLAKYPNPDDFINASHAEKSDYLSKVSNFVEQVSREEKAGNAPNGATNGAVLTQFWISALAWRDLELANAMGEQLDVLNRAAYETACAMGQARPDETVIAEWKEMFGENIDPYSLMD